MSTELPSEPVAWMDDFGNVFPLSANKGAGSWLDDHKRNWKPLYAHPADSGMPEQEWRKEAWRLIAEHARVYLTSQVAYETTAKALDAHLSRRVAVDRDAAKIAAALDAIATADTSKWDVEVRDQFKQWAQSIARHALQSRSASTRGCRNE